MTKIKYYRFGRRNLKREEQPLVDDNNNNNINNNDNNSQSQGSSRSRSVLLYKQSNNVMITALLQINREFQSISNVCYFDFAFKFFY